MELALLKWLRFENKCIIVLNERTPVYGHGQPDVLGVTAAGYLKEIEVKRSMSDFRANAKKFHVSNREHYLDRWPRQFYYAVPKAMVEKVKSELPPWAGLLQVDGSLVELIVDAEINKAARKLTFKQCARLAKCLSNQIACMAANSFQLNSGHRQHCANHLDELYKDGWYFPDGEKFTDYTNYQI